MRNFLIAVTRNPVSLTGAGLATIGAALIVTLFTLELVGFEGGPYIGILAYLVLPLVFLLGLLLIPIGVRRERRRARGDAGHRAFPVIDLNDNRMRTIVLTVCLLSVVNVIVFAAATYKGVEVMESNEFCGTTCHSVMQPEYTAYVRSPHARVACVECHIGAGADWFAKSKLSGAWQVISVTFDLYSRPIPTPVHDLRPARETCEECHWPTQFVGNRLKVITRHADDEANTPLKTVLLMKIGGRLGSTSHGIHWHVDPGVEIRYRSDPTREVVYDVEMTLPDGTTKTFLSPHGEPESIEGEAAEWRPMDCVDCHNRPTHIYGTPEGEVDEALVAGRLPDSLPYLRREGVAAIQNDFASHEEARDGIPSLLEDFYREELPEVWVERRDEIAAAGRELAEIYTHNVFPVMKVDWGTYPNHIGHEQSPGCFRCHDDEHATADGELISQDCESCHGVLAWDEEDPAVLAELGY